ncbi:ChaN family lipoprotein [Cupriavidus sp. AU9028]|uniref:ChaN family lipoprotein n=1 Tax=Cupriavidus sp. AU9028 TaxID=2871157 RepID=UPI001C976FB4|nr:ChaN family lipoprotein [Cupriavidus sp. AU9028]MBY4897726.1 ChaN family lipoprotein [Cupriavidus sp. AU9028]
MRTADSRCDRTATPGTGGSPRLALARAAVALGALGALGAIGALLAGCAGPAPQRASPLPLASHRYVLLGEQHDNADGHQLRLQALQESVRAGWRPVIAMEQFDRERQGELDRARRERPGDADHLIAAAGGPGWDWSLYRPVIALALQYDLPLVAANLSRADARRVVREGVAAVFAAPQRAQLGLDTPLAAELAQAQQAGIAAAHSAQMPASLLPGMAAAQVARDAVMAHVMAASSDGSPPPRPVVLIAGNGHVRKDIGVPRWLQERQGTAVADVFAVGYLPTEAGAGEDGGDAAPAAAFDRIVAIPAVRPR